MSSVAAAERLEEQVGRAAADGATFVSAGKREGAHFPPGVLTGVSPTSPTAAEELFGPVAIVYRARSEDEAVDLANGTPYGLSSYVFTTDAEQAMRVADRIDAGVVFVNGVGPVPYQATCALEPTARGWCDPGAAGRAAMCGRRGQIPGP
ncbi:aldehyde dehydrogenase family protein [Streptomyces achromogenes]|uniref:aldehyde dehydrogenase family protein n=1 Tax=Streptomyces achromogenes TaxID=67255 RepID=UPI00367AB623